MVLVGADNGTSNAAGARPARLRSAIVDQQGRTFLAQLYDALQECRLGVRDAFGQTGALQDAAAQTGRHAVARTGDRRHAHAQGIDQPLVGIESHGIDKQVGQREAAQQLFA